MGQILLEGGATTEVAAGVHGAFPLFMAAQEGNVRFMQLLVTAGAELDRGIDSGATALW